MNVLQSIGIALDMLRQHKLRAFLTMLGVIIGVMSVTMIVMVSNGFQSYINGQFAKLGTDTMFVFFDPGRRERGQNLGAKDKLTTDDMHYLTQRVQALDMASGIMNVQSMKATFGTNSIDNPQIYGADENFRTLNRFNILAGRSLTKDDMTNRTSVCLIGEDVRDRLFPTPGVPDSSVDVADMTPAQKTAVSQANAKAIGHLILLPGVALQVVGIIERQSFLGDSTARMILAPITTAQMKWIGGNKLDMILLRARSGVSTEAAMTDVWQALMAQSGNKPYYRVDSNESIMKVFGGIVGVAGGVLAAIAALSLLVGGIGIMNIMLVSVTERTKEIGLRKAIGARRAAILTQFLIEAGTLSLVGGLIGMGTAWGIGQLVSAVTAAKHWPTHDGLATPFPVTAAIFASLLSAGIGMIFGFYPAMTASKLDPIVALRTE